MSRLPWYHWYQFYSFPRVSGDEPDAKEIPSRIVMFSPRERG